MSGVRKAGDWRLSETCQCVESFRCVGIVVEPIPLAKPGKLVNHLTRMIF